MGFSAWWRFLLFHIAWSLHHIVGDVLWDNQALPLDSKGEQLITGEYDVLRVNKTHYYIYMNDWGGCPGIDCCDSDGGCASCCFTNDPENLDTCVYTTNHSVYVYSTTNFSRFDKLGIALSVHGGNRASGVEFRPHVVYNVLTKLYVMWYIDRWDNGTDNPGYAVATSPTAEGPFITVLNSTTMLTPDKIGDFYIFVDDDGKAYHVRTRFVVELLTEDYLNSARTESTSFSDPSGGGEAPVMFKRGQTYYVMYGSNCCACKGGSSIAYATAPSPLGPFTLRSLSIGTNSSGLFATNAQASTIFKVGDELIWAGNQWVTSQLPGNPRNHDLLYLTPLRFEERGAIMQVHWNSTVVLPFASEFVEGVDTTRGATGSLSRESFR